MAPDEKGKLDQTDGGDYTSPDPTHDGVAVVGDVTAAE
jgi:hypothetical protein